VIAFPLTGEPLALDLVNTRIKVPGGPEQDLIDTDAGLAAWLDLQRPRLSSTSAGQVDAQAVRDLRGDVAVAVDAARHGTRPPARALRALTDAQRAAPPYRSLGWDGAAVTAAHRRSGSATAAVLAQLAEAATDLLTGPDAGRVRQCEGPECVLLFLPAHPKRRWCSPALCGNRVRVARYYQRHKG
jgi:predicted RNA-binding Zn ribbon-like protein